MPALRVHEATLHFVDRGKGPRIVVLLHAFPLHSEMWARQIEALAPRFRVIAPDARGLGASSGALDITTVDVLAEDVADLLEQLGVAKAVVCGLSMGGYVALELYRRARELFAGLVLADTRATSDTPDGRQSRERVAVETLRRGIDWVAQDAGPRLVRERPDAAVVAEVRRLVLGNSATALASIQRGMALRGDSTGTLATIECPTLVLVGAEDRLTPPAEARVLAEGIPGARLEVIDRAGHLSNLDAPAAFDAALLRFLESIPS